jgi:uncharacterized protein (DUF58 family)
LVIGHWSLVIGHWSLVVGRWSLVVGRWSLVVGRWSLVVFFLLPSSFFLLPFSFFLFPSLFTSQSNSTSGESRLFDEPLRRRMLVDPAALMRVRNLELRARVVVQGFLSGLHRSPYHGFSVEFTEYRQYSPGDDTRHIDWRLYARSDRHYLKRYEDETNLRCYLLVDLSRSMAFGSTRRDENSVTSGRQETVGYDKAEYARTLAATLAHFLSLQRDAVGLVTFGDRIEEHLPARYRAGHLRRIYAALERSPTGQSTDIASPLEQIARTSRKRGLVVLISDLLAPVDDMERRLGYLRSQGHDVLILRVLDPAEISFPYDTAELFRDMETERELYVDPVSIRVDYLKKFTAHAEAITKTCRNLGIALSLMTTAQPLESALFDLLQARASQGRGVARRSPGGRGIATGGGAARGGG